MNKDELKNQLSLLIQQGEEFLKAVGSYQGSRNPFLKNQNSLAARKWMLTSSNLIEVIVPVGSFYHNHHKIIMSSIEYNASPVMTNAVEKITGLLSSIMDVIEAGYFFSWEFITFGEAFEEFLNNAEHYHKKGMKNEAAVVASAVLEDTIKKIAEKHKISKKGSFEVIVQALVKAQIISSIKKKEMDFYSGIRNSALHARWEEFDIKETGKLIEGVHELIALHLCSN